MSWEWVAPVATATVGLGVGVAGVFFTWKTGKQARELTLRSATEARIQQRLENAYIAELDIAERAGQWAQSVLPMMDTNPPQTVPSLPSVEEQAHAEALVKAFGSDEVRKLMEVWRDIVKQMISTVGTIAWIEQDTERHRGIQENPRRDLPELRRREREAREAIGEQVAIELGHRTPRVSGPSPWY